MERLMISEDFWNGKRVFITGHTGFKGCWLTLMLKQLNASVIGFSLAPNTTPSMFNDLSISSYCSKSILGNVNCLDSLMYQMEEANPDVMIHMAAQPLVSVGYEDPITTFQTNVMGTVNFLEACRNIGKGLSLVISSDKCYVNNDSGKSFCEEMPLGGKDPYSASKAGTEIVVKAWQESYFSVGQSVSLCSVRAGNVIGGGDWSLNRLIPDICKAFNKNEAVSLRNPNYTRPWQHVLEPLTAYLKIIEWMDDNPNINESWNIGPAQGSVKTVSEISKLCSEKWPEPNLGWAPSTNKLNFSENEKLDLDCSKIEKIIGWKPKLNIEDAIKRTMFWYYTYFNNTSDMLLELTCNQINEYLKSNK